MLLAHQTPPAMATGIRPNAEIAVRAGVKYIQFGARSESEYQDLDNYLKGLRPETSPHLVDGRLSPAAERGRMLFTERGCIGCIRCRSTPTNRCIRWEPAPAPRQIGNTIRRP